MTARLSLPRRVTVYYLLFCTASIAWLAVAAVAVSQAILSARTESACLTRLGKASAALALDYLRHGEDGLQQRVEQLRTEGRLSYCAIVSPEGKVVADSRRENIGRRAIEPTGDRVQWGDVTGTRYLDEQSRLMREYRTPLESGGKTVGSLRFGVPETGVWHTVMLAASYAPLAMLAPLVLVGAGALILARTVYPLSDIESQLRRAALSPSLDDAQLETIPVRGGAAWGWNRLVKWMRESAPTRNAAESHAAPDDLRRELESILQSLSDGIAATDEQGSITFANVALVTLLGLDRTAESLQGESLGILLDLHEEDERRHPLVDFSLVHRTVTVELARTNALGERVLRVARYPLHGAQGRGFVWSVRDVTQQRLADKMRDQFLDSATHELRTPLTNIRAYAETLSLNEVIDIEQQKEFCNIINSEAIRLARFVDELLCISSLEAGSLGVRKQNVELDRLLADATANVRPLMDQKGIAFNVSLPAKLPELRVDKDKFSAALVNLLGNAAKYTPESGQVRLKVRFDEAHLVIDVEDTGVGIAPEELPKVFEKFFRSNDRRVQQQTGTGLGLTFANEVIRLHGGAITVKSELDKGSTFTITLPLG